MASRQIPLVNDHYYHIFNRGVNRQPITVNKWDYKRIIDLLRFYKSTYSPTRFSKFKLLPLEERKEMWNKINSSPSYVDIVAYCLIPNHFHLILKQNVDKGISKFLGNFQNSYTKYFNTKNERTGHLFQGQFKSVLVDTDNQLIHLSRYIHLNPYTSALVDNENKLTNYEWSSFPEYLGMTAEEICNKVSVMTNFSSPEKYKEFVLNNAEYLKTLTDIKHLLID